MIYFVKAIEIGLIKIGYAVDVRSRVKSLQTASPEELEILGCVPGGREYEAIIHRTFHEDRVRGEWFSPSAELLQFIEQNCIEANESVKQKETHAYLLTLPGATWARLVDVAKHNDISVGHLMRSMIKYCLRPENMRNLLPSYIVTSGQVEK